MIDHIYGVQTSDRRHTIMYMHFHSENQSLTQSDITNQFDKTYARSYQKETASKPIRYDQVHYECHKHFLYFISRFAIIYSPFLKVQKFYQGHSVKISCIQKHPSRRLVATGEVNLFPQIHIWDAFTLEPLVILETSHRGGILQLEFSPDGQKLVSIGMDRTFSIQVFIWEQNRCLAFRNLGSYPVFGLKFYPFENSRFVTCGFEHIAVWKLQGYHLTCSTFQKFESQKPNPANPDELLRSVIMCIDFINYRVGSTLRSDVVFGTNQGEITTFQSGKHYLLKQDAHQGAVNCLKVSDRLAGVCVITGGEDGLLKIWTTTFELIQVIDPKEKLPTILKDRKNARAYGIQSIEMYCCDKLYPKRLLIGLRCGEIVEAVVSDAAVDKSTVSRQMQPKLNFQLYSFASVHSSLNVSQQQKKIQCVINPDHPVLISAGDDETLRIWDLEKHTIIYQKYLGAQATSLAYSPDGAYLAVGMVSGIVLILDGKLGRVKVDGKVFEDFSLPSLDLLMSPKESKTAVVCMKYSFNGDFLAVSYNNEYRVPEVNSKNEIGQPDPSFVMIFVNRVSPKNPQLRQSNKDIYIRLLKIVLPLGDFTASSTLRLQLAVTQLDFSDCDGYLEMCVQRINHECVLNANAYTPNEDSYIIWDIANNTLVSNFEALEDSNWPEWSMAPSIHSRYQGSEVQSLEQKEICYMSRVSRFSLLDAAICGSQQGNLYLFRFQSLIIDKQKATDFRFDAIKKRDMAATRSFSGHISMIQCIENFQDKIIVTSSVADQCIIQWRIEYEDKHWELEFNLYLRNQIDPYGEFPSQEKFEKLISEVWGPRRAVPEINQGVQKIEQQDPPCRFELEQIVGRRAYDRRQNCLIDDKDRITYIAGSIQVFIQEDNQSGLQQKSMQTQIKQSFLRPEGESFKSQNLEISCFCLSKDLRILFLGASNIEASVLVWDITTNLKLNEVITPRIPVITNIKVSHNCKNVLMLGITREYYQVMTMIDWSTNKILFRKQFLHSFVFRIRDIDFTPNSTCNFITSGIQHLCFWRLCGSNLEYQVGELTIRRVQSNIGQGIQTHNPTNTDRYGLSLVTNEYQQTQFLKPNVLGNENHDDDYENLFVTFLNIAFIGSSLITSGDDGHLYVWAKERLEHRIFAHEGSIFALHSNSNQNLLVSGGLEGVVTLWRLTVNQKLNQKALERIKVYTVRQHGLTPQQAVMQPECNVQSVCLGQNRIIVGMRSGSIFEVNLQESGKGLKLNKENTMVTPVKRWLKCSDNEIPLSVGMDMISSRIFIITQYGLFQVWDLHSFDVIFQKNYAKKVICMQSFRLSNNIMIVFEHEVIVLDSNPKTNNFDEKADYYLKINQVTFATLNQNEQILGIATVSQAGVPDISLYSSEGGFIKLKQIFGFKSAIKFLDFSTDNYYLCVEDSVGEVTLYEIESDRPIQTDSIDFKLEWTGDGLRTFGRLQGVRHQYSASNKIKKIMKILGKPIIVIADELGTIRLFNYPNMQGESYYKCYAEHLFKLADCVFSPDRRYFISCSEMDRCVMKWKMHFNEVKLQKLIEEEQNKQ